MINFHSLAISNSLKKDRLFDGFFFDFNIGNCYLSNYGVKYSEGISFGYINQESNFIYLILITIILMIKGAVFFD